MPPKPPMDEVTAIMPEQALKRKLGTDTPLRELFPDEAIAAADAAIADSKQSFFPDVAKALTDMEDAYAGAIRDPAASAAQAVRLAALSIPLKGRAETLGFELLALVSQSLHSFCTSIFRAGEKEHLVVLRKHLDILQLILREQIQGDGGEPGRALILGLRQLCAKYAC